jgi:signal peptidase I
LFIAAFVVQSYQVDGQSMEPTLQDNDRLIVDKWQRSWARITKHDYIPRRGDIVIFNQGLDFASGVSKQLIKRVVALPGERVVVKDGKITVYNQERSEGFDPDTLGLYDITVAAIVAPPIDVTLGPNEVYVVGDNRANSEDSRYFGPIKAEKIVGKLAFRIVPLDKAQRF